MAVLTNDDRIDIWSAMMSSGDFPGGLLKAEIRAAVDASDDWVDDNSASYNSALPLAFRSAATASQKARLLTLVVGKRFLAGA